MKKLNSKGFSHHFVLALVLVGSAVIGTFALVATHAQTATCHTTVYSDADVNAKLVCVENLQQLANYVPAVNPKLTVDGYYGPNTATGVRQVEAAYHLTVDSGVAGPQVWGALCSVGSHLAAGTAGYEAALNSGCTMPSTSKPPTPTPAPTPPKTTTPVKVAGGTPTPAPTSVSTPVATSIGCTTTAPQLQEGSTGSCVKELQTILNISPVDGDFGPATKAAVENFQKESGLPQDGVVGPCTWADMGINGGSTSGCPTHPTQSQQQAIQAVKENTSKIDSGKPVAASSQSAASAPRAGNPANESENNKRHQAQPSLINQIADTPAKVFKFVVHSLFNRK